MGIVIKEMIVRTSIEKQKVQQVEMTAELKELIRREIQEQFQVFEAESKKKSER